MSSESLTPSKFRSQVTGMGNPYPRVCGCAWLARIAGPLFVAANQTVITDKGNE